MPESASFPGPSGRPGPLAGRRVLVTAGPTWVRLDAVRHLGNVSSGRTGFLIARRAADLGAEVTLLLGPGRVRPESGHGLRVVEFETFDELHALVRLHVGSRAYDALVHAAAVSDYRPAEEQPGKLSSDAEELVLRLVRTPKIVDEVRDLDPGLLLVKFKLEVGRTEAELAAIARASRERSRADLVVANDLAGMGGGRHPALLLDAGGNVARVETTEGLADCLLGEITVRLRGREARRDASPPQTGDTLP